ncbi:hypothetical protein [Phocaeicola sartorii]|uniref:hypothetical protein n=1 Tax=Phocaeicola sartorii TaxID=671267 RepID=UPI002430CEFC|nr:hypothetical protein [Phocaeicola sartorii]
MNDEKEEVLRQNNTGIEQISPLEQLFACHFYSDITEGNKEELITHEDFQLSARTCVRKAVNQQYKLIRTHSL